MSKKYTKEPVRLRERAVSGGRKSLYLDIYIKGKRKYEYLNLYLCEEKTREDKKRNRDIIQLAEAVKAQRIVEVRNGIFGFDDNKRAENINFVEYYKSLKSRNKRSEIVWGSALAHIEEYIGNRTITFADIDTEWVNGFIRHLESSASRSGNTQKSKKQKRLLHNTKAIYFQKLKACLNQAVKDGIIEKSPAQNSESIRMVETERVYLTLDEVQAMTKTECNDDGLRRAFLFSCLTGLRKSDIMSLRWSQVTNSGGYTRITFTQKKTSSLEYLDISAQAVEYMGDRGDSDSLVFYDFKYTTNVQQELRRWAMNAGISKHVTFHVARHTFATMMLSLGADLYTVSKLLGHKSIETTQIYAKVIDREKRKAVDLIPDIE